MWVGIYHTIATEGYWENGSYYSRDNFLVIYKANTCPKDDGGEDGYVDYLHVTSNIDQFLVLGHFNTLLEYGPESVNEDSSYTIGVTLGVTPDGPEYSASLSETITIHQMEIDSYTSDPDFDTTYNYENIKSNTYAESEHPHFGYMIIETDPNDLTIIINFTALFSDFDWFLSRDTSTISSNFYFKSLY